MAIGNDSDGDRMPDDYERARSCLNPNLADADADPDHDGLTNIQEFQLGTEPCVADTDGDGLSDSQEIARGTNPTDPDTDHDGLVDGAEVSRGTNPLNANSDGGCLPDGIEVRLGLNPLNASDDNGDRDGDGLLNCDEIAIFTDPGNPDTDGDGLTDGEEVLRGTDPLVPDHAPPVVTWVSPVTGTTAIEGQSLTLSATATDDGRVVSVDFLANNTLVATDSSLPYQALFTVPVGVTHIDFLARARDTNNNIGQAGAMIGVIPDPLTTVTGRVIDANSNPVPGAAVSTDGGRSTSTAADGTFSITGVPTILGDVVVSATVTVGGVELNGSSAGVPPVRGGTTAVGDIVVVEARFETNVGPSIAQCDDCSVQRTLPFSFAYFGQTYTRVFVNENGNVTFTSGDGTFTESIAGFSSQPRISPFWDDVDSRCQGNLYVNDQLPGEFVVTWLHNEEYSCVPGDINVQLILFADGRIEFNYDGVSSLDAIVGITPGGAVPLQQVDFSTNPVITTGGPVTLLEQFTSPAPHGNSDSSGPDHPFDLDHSAVLFVPNASGGYDGRTNLNVFTPLPTLTPTTTRTATPTPTITATPRPCPQNDLGTALPTSVTGSTVGQPNAFASTCGGNGAPDVTYIYTAPVSSTYVIDTVGSSFDTVLYVRDGSCAGTQLACNDDAVGAQSRVTANLIAGQHIVIVVDGFGSASGNFTLNVALLVPPTSTPSATLVSAATATPTPTPTGPTPTRTSTP